MLKLSAECKHFKAFWHCWKWCFPHNSAVGTSHYFTLKGVKNITDPSQPVVFFQCCLKWSIEIDRTDWDRDINRPAKGLRSDLNQGHCGNMSCTSAKWLWGRGHGSLLFPREEACGILRGFCIFHLFLLDVDRTTDSSALYVCVCEKHSNDYHSHSWKVLLKKSPKTHAKAATLIICCISCIYVEIIRLILTIVKGESSSKRSGNTAQLLKML